MKHVKNQQEIDLEQRAAKHGFKLRRRGTQYILVGAGGGEIMRGEGFDGIDWWLTNALESPAGIQISTACGMPLMKVVHGETMKIERTYESEITNQPKSLAPASASTLQGPADKTTKDDTTMLNVDSAPTEIKGKQPIFLEDGMVRNPSTGEIKPLILDDGTVCDPDTGEIVEPEVDIDLTGPQIAAKFIKDVFGDTTAKPIHICSLGNERGDGFVASDRYTRDSAEIEPFVKKFDVKGRGAFFCVSTLKTPKRNKENVAEVSMLHTDIDLKDVDESVDEIERRLKTLRYQPSIIVFSGNGVHAYWLLKESIADPDASKVDDIELALRQLSDVVGGDLQVCEVARLMRLPGSHNTKNGERKAVEIVHEPFDAEGRPIRHELSDLEEWLAEQSPIILRKGRPHGLTVGEMAGKDPFEEHGLLAYKPPIDAEKRLAKMMFMGPKKDADGDDVSIHGTQISVECSMYANGHSVEKIVDVVLAATKLAAGDYGKNWNWDREKRNIRRDTEDWIKKLEKKGETPKKQLPVVPSDDVANITDVKNTNTKCASLPMTLFDDVDNYAQKEWLLKGAFAKGETSMLIAPPKKLKSAMMTDVSICIASGTDWRGHRSKHQCGVVYFAFERADLVKRRLAAHRKREDLTGLPISIVGKIVNLMNRNCVEVLVATIREAGQLLGREVGFIVIDTLAKGIAAGGGDENQAKDMGAALAHLRMVQEITGVHISIIHHTGKDESKGARGSNSQLGDVDLMIQISGEGAIKVAAITAANDQAEGEMTRFKGEVVTLCKDEDGDDVTAMILSTDTCQSGEGVEAKTPMSPNDRRALTMLVTAINEAGQPAPTSGHFPPFARVVPVGTWKEYHRRGSVDDTADATRKAFKRASDNLTNAGRIGIFDGFVWVVDG